jgi:hypothetical protein
MTSTHPCELCGAHVVDLRRGRCFACYGKWVASRPVGLGAECVVCGDRRRDNLHGVELLGAWVAMCFNCAGRTQRLDPLPRTLEGIRHRLRRDRRDAERRIGLPDEREVRRERRGLPRRGVGHAVGDDLMILGEELELRFDAGA